MFRSVEKSLNKAVGKVLHTLRTQKGFSQERLAYGADVDRAFISDIERGVKLPSLTIIFKLSKVLEIRPSEMLVDIEHLIQSDKGSIWS